MAPHATALLAVGFAVAATVLEIVSVATPEWFGTASLYSGLWRVCRVVFGITTCGDADADTVPDWLQVVRAFAIVTILFLAVCVASFVATLVRNNVTAVHHLPSAFAGVAGLCACVAFAVYVGKTRGLVTDDVGYRYSFYLTVAAFAVSLLASIFFALAARRRSSYSVLP